MDTSLFDYDLPASAIAQLPSDRRDGSRLLVVNRSTGQVADHLFSELPFILNEPVRCFRNTVSVIKARIYGQRVGGGKVECLLLRPDPALPNHRWWAMLRPGKRLPIDSTFSMEGHFSARVVDKRPDGIALIEFDLPRHQTVTDLANEIGEMPLPPYIQRGPDDPRKQIDGERYQTVYADPHQPYAAAAPTAGLHFTPQVMERMQQNGITFHDLNLHVGLGTFKPIQSEEVEAHQMHEEFYEIPADCLSALRVNDGVPKLAIGTTSMRAMEDFFRSTAGPEAGFNLNPAQPFAKYAGLFIYPPASFHCDHLITNFHLPRSTLLCLVSAFLTPGSTDGIAWLKQIYTAAIKRNFRFYSYGDAMLII